MHTLVAAAHRVLSSEFVYPLQILKLHKGCAKGALAQSPQGDLVPWCLVNFGQA